MTEHHDKISGGVPDGPIFDLARQIHAELVTGLTDGGGLPESTRAQEYYPAYLLGALAAHVANVPIPPHATNEERGQAIYAALQRIGTSPQLMAQITGIPGMGTIHSDTYSQAQTFESGRAEELRLKIIQCGHFSRLLLNPDDAAVHLDYRTTEQISSGLRRRLPIDSRFTLTFSPSHLEGGTSQVYPKQNSLGEVGMWKFVTKPQTEEVPPAPAFRLTAIGPEGIALPSKLTKLLGEQVDIGEVTVNSRLKLQHDFAINPERPYSAPPRTNSELTIPAVLQQAYIGTSRQPLFIG